MTHQSLRIPPCPQRASGHAWRFARERSTRECEAYVCQACGLVRLTSYRTGQIVRYEAAGDNARTAPLPPRRDESSAKEGYVSFEDELPSVGLTTRFLTLCHRYGSEQLAVSIVAAGRSTGVSGLPQSNDWTKWNAGEIRAAIEHLQRKLGS